MKRILDLLKSRSNRKDRGDAVLTTVILSIPLLAICFTFATGVSMAVWQKTSYISSAQMAATSSLTAVQTNGYLGPQSIQKFVSEYLSQTRGITDTALQTAGQGRSGTETNSFTGTCTTAVINGVKRDLPYIEVQLDINRDAGESAISTYSYTSEGTSGTVVAPTGGHGTAVYGQQYRVINAKVWEASKNLSIFGITTPIAGVDSACQGYNMDVSAILFGNNEDLDSGQTCFQPDAFPVSPKLIQQIATPTAQLKESPLSTCVTKVANLPKNSIVAVTGTYRVWSQVTAYDRYGAEVGTGWVLTASLEKPSTWDISYDLSCDVNGCSTVNSPNPTSYNWSNGTDPITLNNPTKDHYNYGGWQQTNCATGAALPGRPASTNAQILLGSYDDLCFKAVFVIHKIGVTFDPGVGATGGRARTVYNWGTVVPVPGCAVKTGYDFKGWQNSAGTLIATATGTGASCAVSGNITVTGNDLSEMNYSARWANSTYTVSRNYNTGCYASGGQGTYLFSESQQNVALGGATSAGYQNLTWTVNSGPGSISGNNVVVPARGLGNIVVTASCTQVPYNVTVTSNPAGGSNTGNKGTFTISGGAVTLARPALTGYNFSSWTITQNTNGQASSVNTSNNVVSIPAGAYGNIVVQANMTAATYSISYNCNGRGNCPSSPSSYTYGTAPNIGNASGGGSFDGWSLNTSARSNLRTGTSVIPAGTTGNVTVYAHWTWTTTNDYRASGSSAGQCAVGNSNYYGCADRGSCNSGDSWVSYGSVYFTMANKGRGSDPSSSFPKNVSPVTMGGNGGNGAFYSVSANVDQWPTCRSTNSSSN